MLQVDSPVPHKIYAEVVDQETLRQFEECLRMDGCIQGALMPDTHLGYVAPIGSVLKFTNQISPALVGYDIGCGMCAAKLNITKHDINLTTLKDAIITTIPLGSSKHKKSQQYKPTKGTDIAHKAFIDVGQFQIGTLGGGNHFIEIGEGNDGYLWIVIHSGSRGYGYKIAEHYMKEAALASIDEQCYIDEFNNNPKNIPFKANNPIKYEEACKEFVYKRTRARLATSFEGTYSLQLGSQSGQDYLKDMNSALDFALANRETMINRIILNIQQQLNVPPTIIEFINRNHNHAEVYNSSTQGTYVSEVKEVIHRKGATHAENGMMGVIPGNMRDGSFIVRGKGNSDSMSSSSHGAGRVLSRRQAKEQIDLEDFHKQMEGIVTNHTDATKDEAPAAYKSIFEVMELQQELVEVVDHITPLLNIKG